MRCPKHNSEMTPLFTSYVCDACDPPKLPSTAAGKIAAALDAARKTYPQGVDTANYLRCSTCGERAVNANGRTGIAQCPQGHQSQHTIKPGHRVETTKFAGLGLTAMDSEWDGNTWKQIRPIPAYRGNVDAESYVRCPLCGERATDGNRYSPAAWQLMCPQGHHFLHVLATGHKVATSKAAGRNASVDREWTGIGWMDATPAP